jgi:hypothetical protein
VYRGFQLSETIVMAVPTSRTVDTDQSVPLQLPQLPSRAQILNNDIERALPRFSENMDLAGARKRGLATRNENDNAESSPGSTATLTPSSSRDGDDARGLLTV